jgi:hypothetical protein
MLIIKSIMNSYLKYFARGAWGTDVQLAKELGNILGKSPKFQ